MKRITSAAVVLFCLSGATNAQEGNMKAAKLICSAHSSAPANNPAFQLPMQISIDAGGVITGQRSLQRPGKENFVGVIGTQTRDVMLTGTGGYDDGPARWSYEFHGKLNPSGITTLKGRQISNAGSIGGRQCTLLF